MAAGLTSTAAMQRGSKRTGSGSIPTQSINQRIDEASKLRRAIILSGVYGSCGNCLPSALIQRAASFH
jgi:hypothetical protein